MKLKKIDLNAMMEAEQKKRKIWKLVLTGGPCGGKTTGQARLSTFFENLGWKVYRVPETATVLLGGGVNFADLPEYAQSEFQSEAECAGKSSAHDDPDRELLLCPGRG
jgi:hypothetical protein